jgi:hypothetical protein
MSIRKIKQVLKQDERISGRDMIDSIRIERRKKNNDLCELQNEERQRNMKACISIDFNSVHFVQKGRSVCNLNISTSDIELLPLKFKDYNPLLTNADRSWIITHTQSEIFHVKNCIITFLTDRRRGRKSLQDYLQKNHEIFTLQVNVQLNFNH